MFRLEVSVESHGADGKVIAGYDHPAERDRDLELLPVANDRDQLQDGPYSAVWTLCLHDRRRSEKRQNDGGFYDRRHSDDHHLPVRA